MLFLSVRAGQRIKRRGSHTGARRRSGAGAEQIGKGIVGRRRCGSGAHLHAQDIAADLHLVAVAQHLLSTAAQRPAVDADRVAAAINDSVAAVAVEHLCMDARDGAVGVGQHQLVGVGAADRAAQLVEASAQVLGARGAVVGGDGQRDHSVSS